MIIIISWSLDVDFGYFIYKREVGLRTKGASAPLASGIANVPGRIKW
jgi:hypothetical protein